MRNLVFLGFIAVVLFAVVGWFMDWYSFTSVKTEQGKSSVQVEFDWTKVQQDIEKGKNKIGNSGEQVRKDTAPAKPAETKTVSQMPPWFN